MLRLLTALALTLWANEARAQPMIPLPGGVHCWPVPNGEAQTIQCANGYWITIMPDGSMHQDNGFIDPNANLMGSRIINNPTTQTPNGKVIPPEQSISPGPGQWYYGSPIPTN